MTKKQIDAMRKALKKNGKLSVRACRTLLREVETLQSLYHLDRERHREMKSDMADIWLTAGRYVD